MEMIALALVFGLGMVAGFLLAVALLGVVANHLPQDYSWPGNTYVGSDATRPRPYPGGGGLPDPVETQR
jgi:hypothetical protein